MNWLKRLFQLFGQKKKPAPIPKVAICVGHRRINDSGGGDCFVLPGGGGGEVAFGGGGNDSLVGRIGAAR